MSWRLFFEICAFLGGVLAAVFLVAAFFCGIVWVLYGFSQLGLMPPPAWKW